MNKNIKIIIVVAAFILAIPLVAMQFTNEVNWTLGDFIIAGGLLLGTGFAFEVITRKMESKKHKVAMGIILFLILIYVKIAGAENHMLKHMDECNLEHPKV